jgi:predicted acyltransferase
MMSAEPPPRSARIASIDALRGFDMFFLTGGYRLTVILGAFFTLPPCVLHQMDHSAWEGFTAWDLIMPLFLFIVGAAMPFSFGKRLAEGQSRRQLHWKIIRRVLILWILGMVVQGNLLDFNLSKLYFFSNTLQAIAVGYLVASLALIYLPIYGQFLLACVLLIGFWLLMMLVPAPGCPAGTIQEKLNLAWYVDGVIFDGFRVQAPDYYYTWILSSLGFAGSVLLGAMSGHLLRSAWTPRKKTGGLILAGAACLLLGWIWSGGFGWLGAWRFPIIKPIWTSSMVLWSAGWCYLLLAFCYLVIDVLGFRKWAFFFMVMGANSITAYMLAMTVDFNHIAHRFVGGLQRHLQECGGPWPPKGDALQSLAAFAILWLILWYMYRRGSFVRI